MTTKTTTLFRARVPAQRLKKAEAILGAVAVQNAAIPVVTDAELAVAQRTVTTP